MPEEIPEMVDVAFDLDGGVIPATYPFALWENLVRLMPQLAEEKLVGVLPIRATESNEGLLLPRRAKLVLRLPATLAEAASHLAGATIRVGAGALRLGSCKTRTIQPYPTIHAQLVASASDEMVFMERIRTQLSDLKISAKLICGKRRTLNGEGQTIHGFSLVIHDLKPEASLRLQYAGLGEARHLGCGIFVPHKTIAG